MQETGYSRLHADGIDVIAADRPDQFVDDTVSVRQPLAPSPSSLRQLRSEAPGRRGAETPQDRRGKIAGRISLAEKRPEAIALAPRLVKQRQRLSLREISTELATHGFTTPRERSALAALPKLLDASLVGFQSRLSCCLC